MPKIHIKKVADSCSIELKLLTGQIVEAIRAEPLTAFKLPSIPQGDSVSFQLVVRNSWEGFFPGDCWAVERVEIFRALQAAGQELAAQRFKRQGDLKTIGLRKVITLPIGHPDFEFEEVV